VSYSVVVYSSSPEIVRTKELEQRLRWKGWELRFFDRSRRQQLRHGALRDNCLAIAWKSDPAFNANVETALEKGDESLLGRISRKAHLGSCMVYVKRSYSIVRELNSDELSEVRQSMSASHFRLMRAAVTRYTTESYYGRSDDALEIQVNICGSIGRAVGGLLEDPQMDFLLNLKPRRFPPK
jgi:hypothetical protein